MKHVDLCGAWRIRSLDNVFDLPGTVPGTFFHDLEKSGHWGERDVFYRENNRLCVELANRDFSYSRSFNLPGDFFEENVRFFLEADGLDTLTEIFVNGEPIAKTENMFRRYAFDVSHVLKRGENQIEIIFRNSVAEISNRFKKRPLWNDDNTLNGANQLRKNHCSYGWDWGPVIPDLGVWRSIQIAAYKNGKIKDLHIRQQHEKDGSCTISINAEAESWGGAIPKFRAQVKHPSGELSSIETDASQNATIKIQNPERWWPRGYGEQFLYEVTCELFFEDELADAKTQKIGLRTLRLERKQDEFGESFHFVVNGVPVFARGANYIPEDVYLARADRSFTERLVRDATLANYNCLRVWGGGVYPSNDFFDLCDQYGVIVWQDLMYACGVYDIHNPEFYANIKAETEDVLRRIRHHACLGLICGNNEMEWAFEAWNLPLTKEMRTEYLKQYEILFPEIVQKVCPEVDYWSASPSSGGNFDEPNDENRGDVHFWEVWHGNKPFTEYRNHYFRFLSEFGFESFPSIKTVNSFTEPEDRNAFSPVMEDHQRCVGGNGKILTYLSQYFRYPKDLSSLIYVSQLSQAEAIRYGVEHMRRHRGRCMGATYWQFNDNWPVASWSSIDYFGRWKALMYQSRRMYRQVLLSCEECEKTASLHLSNENSHAVHGEVSWRLLTFSGEVLQEGKREIEAPALSSQKAFDLDFSEQLSGKRARSVYLSFRFRESESGDQQFGTATFARYKELNFQNAHLQWRVLESPDGVEIAVSADAFAKFVELDLKTKDVIFSDNFFDLDAGQTRRIRIIAGEDSASLLNDELIVRSLVNSY